MRAARPFALNTAVTEALLVHTGQPPFRASLTALLARQEVDRIKETIHDLPSFRPAGRRGRKPAGVVRHHAGG